MRREEPLRDDELALPRPVPTCNGGLGKPEVILIRCSLASGRGVPVINVEKLAGAGPRGTTGVRGGVDVAATGVLDEDLDPDALLRAGEAGGAAREA